ncbi:aminotransferase class III-fold pyridoxal phosphate-dependent enzyme, partial [Micromonospora sp. DH15]|nr:aminotransferase class III-fold pyridoxal phosphate-dependent enzyme [Micromonospora sp. DH15]
MRSGFRMAPGGAQERYGVQADLVTFSKAMANGYPISALVGREEVMRAVGEVHISSTFHVNGAEMAAAVATISQLRDGAILTHVERLGERLQAGLAKQFAEHGLPGRVLGVPHHAQFGDVAAVLLGREATGDAGDRHRLSVARGVASGRALPDVLDAAGVDPAAVADVRLCGATVAVQQAARAEFGAAFPRARTWVGGASSPAVGPVCALAEAVAPPTAPGTETAAEGEAAGRVVVVVAGRPGAWDVVLAR